MSNRMYLDDSGTKDYAPIGVNYGQGVDAHFVFGGFFGPEDACAQPAQRLIDLKRRTFGQDIEIKSNWIRIPKEREARYLRPFGLTIRDLDSFLEEYYDHVCEADVQMIAAVVDKPRMRAKYGQFAYLPPVVALEVLAQRIQLEFQERKGTCHITIDEMTGRDPTKMTHRDRIEKAHASLCKTGSHMMGARMALPSLGSLSFEDSQRSTLVQVADIIAYNVFRQFRDHGDEWDRPDLSTLDLYEPLGRVAHKFRADPQGRIQGLGIIRIPMIRRVEWRVPRRSDK